MIAWVARVWHLLRPVDHDRSTACAWPATHLIPDDTLRLPSPTFTGNLTRYRAQTPHLEALPISAQWMLSLSLQGAATLVLDSNHTCNSNTHIPFQHEPVLHRVPTETPTMRAPAPLKQLNPPDAVLRSENKKPASPASPLTCSGHENSPSHAVQAGSPTAQSTLTAMAAAPTQSTASGQSHDGDNVRMACVRVCE